MSGPDLSYGVVSRDELLSQDGLILLNRMIRGELPAPPIAELLGIRLTEAEHGRCVFIGLPSFKHYNPSSQVHGGFALSIMDSALGCAIHTTLAAGETYTTLEIKVNMVRGMSENTGEVRAEGHVLHRGRTTATADGKLTDADGRLLAHAVTTCMIFPAAKA